MLCQEKREIIRPIAKIRNEILGAVASYVLEEVDNEKYAITVLWKERKGRAVFCGDFFRASEVFRAVVNTDTLPENMEDIERDLAME